MTADVVEEEIFSLVKDLITECPTGTCPPEEFLGAQFDRGLAWVNHPRGMGGFDADVRLQAIVNHLVSDAGGPEASAINPIGHGMCAPTLVVWGNETQRDRFLRPLFTGEEIWCQLFSEPSAGSDIAGLATRATRTDLGWMINGQKVWTTMAHRASWGLLIARSDPDAVKHAGLTAFVLDMSAPGVEVRPLYQMTGEAEFNEVFFDEVFVPDEDRLGPVGGGWKVAVTTLMNERVSIGGGIPQQGEGPIKYLMERYLGLCASQPQSAALHRQDVVELWVRAETLRLLNIRLAQLRTPGEPGPEGSIGKILSAQLNKDIYSELVQLLGPEGMLFGPYARVRPTNAMEYSTPQKAFLRSRANSIEGGTTEIMRNILAERMLGMPGDSRSDKGIPWNQIPRG